jgi:hypothetical protein
VDGHRFRVSLEGCSGALDLDGRVMVRLLVCDLDAWQEGRERPLI